MIAQSPLIIGTAGHIDHGKTNLIKALTGIDTDRLKQEKDRGISIDLGYAYFDLPDGARCGIVDVPGHERFIRNMLAGATGFDMVLFVVAADDGIMPQTREHLYIMHLLGVGNAIFIITKSDIVDEGRLNKVALDIKGLIRNTCLKASPIISVSSHTGAGIDRLKNLIHTESKKVLPRQEGGFFRLPVDRSFSIKGFGAVVTGTVASGSIRKNEDAVLITKGGVQKKVKIRGLQSHFQPLDSISAGQRGAVNLSNISHTDIKRGDILASADLDVVFSISDVSFEFLESLKKPIKNHSMFKLHHLTGETLARIVFADVKEVGPGDRVFGQIRLKEPMVLMRGDRFILRDQSINETIGGGKVLFAYSKKRKGAYTESTMPKVGWHKILNSEDSAKILLSLLSDKNIFAMNRHQIRLMLNISENRCEGLIASCNAKGEEIVQIGEQLILKDKVNNIAQHIVNTINKHHADNPSDIGIEEDYIRKKISDFGFLISDLKAEIVKTALNNLLVSGKIAKTGNVFYMPSHKAEAKGMEKEIGDALISMFSDKGYEPVKMDEILQRHSYKKEDIKKVFQLLIKRGVVVKITEDSYISHIKLDDAKDRMTGWIADKGKIKAAEFRDILGCGRKFAIELLEYFDKERFTLRSGDYRVLRKKINV